MPNVVVKENHLTFGGKKYFRGGAEDVTLGSYGKKKTPVFGQNYLAVEDRLPEGLLEIESATIAEIDFQKSNQSDFSATAKVSGKAKAGTKASFSSLHSHTLKLVKLTVLPTDVQRAANRASRHLQTLDKCGNKARIAHQIFVVMEANEAREFTRSGSFDLSVKGKALTITGKGSGASSGKVQVTLSEGTTYAYLLLKLKWKKGEIDSTSVDQWSMN